METISITIPREEEVLRKTADYLLSLAGSNKSVTDIEEDLTPDQAAEAMEGRIDETIANATAVPSLLDIEGRPWDTRIDSSAKSKTKDGKWKLKRGISPELVAQVKAELLKGDEPVVETVPIVETPAVVPSVVETPAATPPIAVAVNTYSELSALITERVQAGTLQPTDILDACKASGAHAAIGASSFPDLAKPEAAPYIPLIAEQLRIIWVTRA